MNKPRISIIAAVAENNAIGNKNQLLWHISEDMKNFKEKTTNHVIIMGQKTFESLGKPLPNRTNIVLSRDIDFKADGCTIVHSIDEALDMAKKIEKEEIFIIGGGQIYQSFMPYTDRLYLTLIHNTFDADTFFPDHSEFNKVIDKRSSQNEKYRYDFLVLEK